jgi:glycosyltransferase involved in cell wall biosynthesis
MKYRVFVSNRAKLQAEKLYDFFGFPEEKKQHLKWIVNCTSVPAEKPVKPLSEKLRIVFVGRNSPEKRPHLVYRIISECVKQTKKIEFSFVGNFEERNMKGTKFYGIVYDIKIMEQIWKENDILLLTSEREGFPMVVMEAMAHGVVPVCTPVGDIPLHLNSDRGILLSNDSEDAVVNNAVKILLNLTENRRPIEQMSLNCYNYAKSHYSLERFRKEYLGLF